MIPWMREKFAESRLRWQNRKQQRDDLLVPSPSISTVCTDASTPCTTPTNANEPPAATATSVLHGHTNSNRRHGPNERATAKMVQCDFAFIHQQKPINALHADRDAKNHRRSR